MEGIEYCLDEDEEADGKKERCDVKCEGEIGVRMLVGGKGLLWKSCILGAW
jgi:hypothetical protein